MIVLASFLAGDTWTWDVAMTYQDEGGVLLNDRERWVMRVGKQAELTAERTFLGSVVADGALVPASDVRPEILKGKVAPDGTLTLKGEWSDPAASRALRRFLKSEKKDDRLPLWPVVRRATLVQKDVRLPGGEGFATLRIEATLVSARLGGKNVRLPRSTGG